MTLERFAMLVCTCTSAACLVVLLISVVYFLQLFDRATATLEQIKQSLKAYNDKAGGKE